MYKITITAEGQTSKGKPLAVGTEISSESPEILLHCVPGFRNAPPVAKAADDFTAEAVAIVLERQRKIQTANRPVVQNIVDGLATRLPVDSQTGDFKRNEDGTIPGASEAAQIQIDNAAAYGITPQLKPVVVAEPAEIEEPPVISIPTDDTPTAPVLSLSA